MWITRFQMDSPEKIEKFVQEARLNGFNALFVQVLGRGLAYYDSKIIPKVPLDFDPLRLTVEKSHNNGIKVHAWLNAYYVWSRRTLPENKNHIINKHPEWVISDGTMKFLNPSIPGVQDYLYNAYIEVARNYAVDGIHFDYIRYPNDYSGINSKSRHDYKISYGMDPIYLFRNPRYVKRYYGEKGYRKLKNKWADFRCLQVSTLVKRVYDGIKSFNRDMEISAAVFADNSDARYYKGQDWISWLDRGSIDFVVPMIYSSRYARFRKLMKYSAEKTADKKVVIGMGAYKLSSKGLAQQMNLYNKFSKTYKSLSGFCLFSYDSIAEHPMYLEKMKRYAF